MRNALQVFVGIVLIVLGVGVVLLSLTLGPGPCSCPPHSACCPPPAIPDPGLIFAGAILLVGGGFMTIPALLRRPSSRK
jgi:hypothetical protein